MALPLSAISDTERLCSGGDANYLFDLGVCRPDTLLQTYASSKKQKTRGSFFFILQNSKIRKVTRASQLPFLCI